VLQAYAAPRADVPVVLASVLPLRLLGPQSLVFAVSFSGETEETLALASAALRARARVVAVTTGGALRRAVSSGGGAVLGLGPAASLAEPRAAVGASAARILLACEQLGLLSGVTEELSAARQQLRLRSTSLGGGGGVAAEVARRIGRTIPLVHGAAGLGAVAARRWKAQVNENAKSPAFAGVQPEVCHNEVVGFGQQGDVTRQVMTLVNLRTGLEDARLLASFGVFADLVSEALAGVVDVEAAGEGELARFFDLVMIGDFVSLHLAGKEGIDPGPVPAISELKLRLGSEPAP
jgi:glucose/mannose-6-phosphate isomerase